MSTKANPPPTHHRKPAKNHPWNAQGKQAKPKAERAAEPPSIAERKPHRRWGAA